MKNFAIKFTDFFLTHYGVILHSILIVFQYFILFLFDKERFWNPDFLLLSLIPIFFMNNLCFRLAKIDLSFQSFKKEFDRHYK